MFPRALQPAEPVAHVGVNMLSHRELAVHGSVLMFDAKHGAKLVHHPLSGYTEGVDQDVVMEGFTLPNQKEAASS